jgi:hypothetical protein
VLKKVTRQPSASRLGSRSFDDDCAPHRRVFVGITVWLNNVDRHADPIEWKFVAGYNRKAWP